MLKMHHFARGMHMLDCSKNSFCASLPDSTRAKLCAQCHRHLSKAGSMRLYENFGREVSVILDGVMSSSSFVGEDDIAASPIPPVFALFLPGRPISLDVTFYGREQVGELPYNYNDIVCLTDCCIATFDHELFRTLYAEDRDFAWTLAQASMSLIGDVTQFAALMRADSVYTKVNLLMQKLLEFDLYLSRKDMAATLACNRSSVSRAWERTEAERPEFFAQYRANKNRPAEFFRTSRR